MSKIPQFSPRLVPVLTLLVAVALGAYPTYAQTISSTVNEDNGTTFPSNPGPGDQNIYNTNGGTPEHPAIVNSGGGAANTGYNFSSNFMTLTSISSIQFTMTMIDGDSGTPAQVGGAGDFDFNHLVLYLGAPSDYNSTTGILTGGVNTGLVLNGFRGNGLQDTQTFSIAINSATTGAAIMTELTTGGGHLDAFVVSNNTADTVAAPNQVFVGNDTNNALTTLTFNAVPEPSTYMLIGLGALMVLAPGVRRFRRNL